MKIISIFNQKGGTGKTTSAVNIAGCLDREFGEKILVIDCDSQMNSSNYLMTAMPENMIPHSLKSCMENQTDLSEAIIPIRFQQKNKEIKTNINLIASDKKIEMTECQDIQSLKKAIGRIKQDYDWIIFDCPPHISNITAMALTASNYVLVPALADMDSLGGYDILIDTVNDIRTSGYNMNLKILGVFFNNVELNKALDKFIKDNCTESMGRMVFETYIKRSSAIPQARFYGLPVSYYKRKSEINESYIKLVKEIKHKINTMEEER